MDVATVLTQIKRQFGDEYGVVITDDDCYGYIYEAELDIIRNTGENAVSLPIPVENLPLAIPTFVSIKRVTVDNKALVYLTLQELDMLGADPTVKGTPSHYYMALEKLNLYPVPDTGFTGAIAVQYSKVPTLMSGTPASQTFTVPDVYHTDILKFCRAKAHNKNQNFQAEQVEMAAYNESVGNRREEAYSVSNVITKISDPWDWE